MVARAMSLGQPTLAAKLRWIDSFAYFQFQLARLDDRVAGEDRRGGVARLYETLIDLDPQFIPFYEHAVLNAGAILGQHQVALGFIERGLLEHPRHTGLHRQEAAELAVTYDWSNRQPALLDRILQAWADAETDATGRQLVADWRRGLAFRHVRNLETLPYWIEQLHATRPGTPLGDFVESTIRELLAQHGEQELPQLLAGSHEADPLRVDPLRVRIQYPQGIPSWSSVADGPTGLILRNDPFGWPYRRDGKGGVLSPGREQLRFLSRHTMLRLDLEARARREGRPPADAAEAAAWGFPLPTPPDGGRWDLSAPAPQVVWPDPPAPPWKLR
jgi:hypothetical protein